MAANVPEAIRQAHRPAVRTGKQILDIITSGMYSISLMALREYVQNAVDAIDDAVRSGLMRHAEGRVDVFLDGSTRTVCICDNGIGIPAKRVMDVLCAVGVSGKTLGASRGFRGIGRLGGIGYCDRVEFETRSGKGEPVSVVVWDAKKLRSKCHPQGVAQDALDVIEDVVSLSHRPSRADEGEHFFRVTMHRVHRFHRDDLMNVGAVRDYLGQVAPVPFDQSAFLHARRIEEHLAGLDGYRNYSVFVNGKQIFRPHATHVAANGKTRDRIADVEVFEVRGRDAESIGRGWYARMEYVASIPPSVGMRGIRVRQGNIEVGNEHFLAEFFAERRFATWHVGEIHLNYVLRVNARRDGFEQSPDYEAFLEQAGLLGRHLSYLCRKASKARSRRVCIGRVLSRAESVAQQPFFCSEEHMRSALHYATTALSRAEASLNGAKDASVLRAKIAETRAALDRLSKDTPLLQRVLDGRCLRHIPQKELVSSIAAGIVEQHSCQRSAESLVQAVLQPYLKARARA